MGLGRQKNIFGQKSIFFGGTGIKKKVFFGRNFFSIFFPEKCRKKIPVGPTTSGPLAITKTEIAKIEAQNWCLGSSNDQKRIKMGVSGKKEGSLCQKSSHAAKVMAILSFWTVFAGIMGNFFYFGLKR